MKKPNFKANIVFSFISRFIVYLTPLFVAPYLSRVLGAEGIGIYSHAYSFVFYFASAISFGFSSYGINKIAANRDDKEKYSAVFWTVYFLRALFFILITTVYVVILVFTGFGNKVDFNIGLSLILVLVASLLENQFLFQGLEIFLIPTIGDCVVNLSYAVCIFCFVKNSGDVLLYTTLKSGMNVVLYFGTSFASIRYLAKPKILWNELGLVIKESAIFFLPTILMSIGSQIDQSLIGSFCTDAEVGYYQQASKFPMLVSSFTYAISPVMLSRVSYLYHANRLDEVRVKITSGLTLALFVSIPACVGLYSIGETFLPLFFGEEFTASVPIMFVLLPSCVLSPVSSILINAYYYPADRKKYMTISQIVAVSVNVLLTVLNLTVLDLGAIGAAIGTLVADVLATICFIVGARKMIGFKSAGIDSLKIIIGSGITAAAAVPICYFLSVKAIYRIILAVVAGMVVYGLTELISKEKIFTMGFNLVKGKFKRTKNQ